VSTVRAALRWVVADLRARRGQPALAVLSVAGIVTALLVSAALLVDGADPWRRLFGESHGAHVWVHTQDRPSMPVLTGIDGVSDVAGPYRTVPVTSVQDGTKAPTALWAMPDRPPAVGRPLVRQGRWFREQDEVVVERSFARALGLRVGGPLVVMSPDGMVHQFVVAGVADSTEQGFYPEWTPGLAWAAESTVARIEPERARSQWASGLRLSDGGQNDTRLAVQSTVTKLDKQVQRISTWSEVRASMQMNDRLLGSLLGLFGVVGLIAAVLALANAAGGRVLTQLRDLAALKALGLTSRQTTAVLVAEHGALGLLGVALGLVCGQSLVVVALEAPPIPSVAASVGAGTALVVLAAVLLPAWRGGRTPPLPAVPLAAPRGRLSRLARLALLARLPPALVLGARDAFARRSPALLTFFGAALPMMLVTIGLGCWAALEDFERRPERIGQAASLEVRPGRLPAGEAERLIRSDPDVVAVYPGGIINVLEANQTRSVLARAIGDSTRPYPFEVVEGRPIATSGEAVAGQGLLDLMGVRVGERVRITVGSTPLILRIVGRVIEPEQNGAVLSFGTDSLPAQYDWRPESYRLVLTPNADETSVRARLLAASRQGLAVERVVNPAERLAVIRMIIVALVAVLTLIGLANLLAARAIGLRDHAAELAALRAIGLTPRQVTMTLVVGSGLLVVLGVVGGGVTGALLSGPLIDLQGQASGVGAGIGRAPSVPALAMATAVAIAAGLLVLLIPARRAARARIPVSLH
jgi:putative ABC transport system permease protein